jgi:hypothetical protein
LVLAVHVDSQARTTIARRQAIHPARRQGAPRGKRRCWPLAVGRSPPQGQDQRNGIFDGFQSVVTVLVGTVLLWSTLIEMAAVALSRFRVAGARPKLELIDNNGRISIIRRGGK